jgi:hypothetical protein
MFVTQKTLTTTTTTSSSSLGGYRGKEVVQKSRSSMRSTARRNNVNVVVRAEAQKTIDMNEVSFTLRLILLFLFVSLFSLLGWKQWFIFLLCLLLDPSSVVGGWDERYRRQNG